ncbi:FG-GAP repeat domain-containing protein [Hyalangium versicolor]|uniref:FG-GAP repeat domain-containing protein n=1 Tax=Hyalangium versicolor TaxID=2861190 RepID=UPI001CCEBD0A|nr:VCBS repeat-containing protein [Hyalangium versicolor]
MSNQSTMSWVGFVAVSLFAFGCGQPEALDVEAALSTGSQSLASCNSMGRFPNVTCADFNGDGLLDLAVNDAEAGTVSVLLGQVDGTLGSPVVFAAGGGGGVVVQDFNGDGWVDLAVTSESDGTVTMLLGHGPGGFSDPMNFASLPSADELAVAGSSAQFE